ncbi:hypothetical protein [Salmonirosea aquatica]|uniref:Secretion system C-terminal sorting domain-containing protein n=1 Tax=Salmonirosea aquatica TaxID=2654236 RepID=A0A7C9BLV3_9BACT|nr:hypothetical protein [Cytophagaceae bacterium SJW1-29]
MKTLMTFALACALGLAPNADAKIPSAENSPYVVTKNMAMWMGDNGKLKVSFNRQEGRATIELRNGRSTLYQEVIALHGGAMQSFDLSRLPSGTYEIRVIIGQQVTSKTVEIGYVKEHTFKLN